MYKDGYQTTEGVLDQFFLKRRKEHKQNEERLTIDLAYQKALEQLQKEEPVQPKDFARFDKEMIERDEKLVQEMEQKFAQEDTEEDRETLRYATILEAIIHEQAELNEWLGEEVMTIKASRYDDIVHGIDSIAEYHREEGISYLALALDVTSGNPREKLRKIREQEINTGKLSEIKYFRSSDETLFGSLTKIPRVIIGADRKAIVELANLWTQHKRKELAEHPIQLQLLEEIACQLAVFASYARERGQQEISRIYLRQLRLIESIQQSPSKKALAEKPTAFNYRQHDRVFEGLQKGLEQFTS